MPGRKTGTAAVRQVSFRLTEDEYDQLLAAAYLEEGTPTELAHQCVVREIERLRQSARVQRLVQERHEHASEQQGTLSDLRQRALSSAPAAQTE